MTNGKEAGFTLLETLVAFAILSAAIIFSFRVFADGMSRIRHAEAAGNRTRAANLLLQDILSRQRLGAGQWNETSGGVSWKVEAKLKLFQLSPYSEGVRVLRVQVFDSGSATESSLAEAITSNPVPIE